MSNPIEMNELTSRRGFFKILIVLFNGLIAAALVVPGLGYLLTPVFRKDSGAWISLGAIEKFRANTLQKATFTYVSEAGYTRAEKNGFVWLKTSAGDSPDAIAFSPVCSHTGCNVNWHASRNAFICPCHNGTYDADGNVVSGPPPRPLQKLPVKIENDQIFVQLVA